MQESHPRFSRYPHHRDYADLGIAYVPYLMYLHRPRYRSKAVNTDAFGLREQYADGRRFLALETASRDLPAVSVIVGSSTVFGVDASSDHQTIAAHLTTANRTWINLGVRAATSAQELLVFLHFKRLLPRIDEIVVLSGINNISLAALEPAVLYPDFGGFFSFEFLIDHLAANKRAGTLGSIGAQTTHVTLKSVFAKALGKTITEKVRSVRSRTEHASVSNEGSLWSRLEVLQRLFDNELQTWSCIAKGLGARLRYVLQPVVGWTEKALTPIENELVTADLELIPSMRTYTTRDVHLRYRDEVSRLCARHGIEFHDANEWLGTAELAKEDVFTDICHMSDGGYRLMAELLTQHLGLQGKP